jgi:catechol 2,3-dioxygenase-like lactoylglutathione lyase family enzyme
MEAPRAPEAAISIRNIVIACPDPPALAEFYAELLGWQVLRRDWLVVGRDAQTFPRLAFGDGPGEYRPPRWPDPAHPQQLHLDFPASDLDTAEAHAARLGATRLQDRGNFRTYADPDGHPFCVYRSPSATAGRPLDGRIGLVVYDCFSPRALASFYERLLSLERVDDEERWVMSAWNDGRLPRLGFQHSQATPPRWPDPAYPQQIHLDLDTAHGQAAGKLALELGAISLPAQGGSCPVFADPAAHPFCLCSPGQ